MLTLIAITTCALLSDPNSTNGTTTEIKYVTREDALQPRTIDSFTCPLRWSEEWSLNSEYKFLLTHHNRWNDRSLFCIYLKLSAGYALVKQIELEELANFAHIKAFWWTMPIPPKEKIPLIWVQELNDGTGHFTFEILYTFADLPSLSELEKARDLTTVLPHIIQDVEYVEPPAPFKLKLGKGRGFEEGSMTNFGSEGLFFENHIFNEGDGGSPSGDKVSGTMKVVKQKLPEPKSYGPIKVSSIFRVETDSFKQAPRTPDDY